MAGASQPVPEVVFVVDVSALTEKGFLSATEYKGRRVGLQFDDQGSGVFLTSEMAKRLHVKKGSTLSVIVEDDTNRVTRASVAAVGATLRISDPGVYYSVGREGGAVIRIRKE